MAKKTEKEFFRKIKQFFTIFIFFSEFDVRFFDGPFLAIILFLLFESLSKILQKNIDNINLFYSQAIIALTFAEYAAKPFFPNCEIPSDIVKILAVICLCLLTAINCMSTNLSMKVQNVFTAGKIIALISVIVMGVISFFRQDSHNFENAWNGNYDPSSICYAFMQGLFAFGGWNYLNFVTGELQDPYK